MVLHALLSWSGCRMMYRKVRGKCSDGWFLRSVADVELEEPRFVSQNCF